MDDTSSSRPVTDRCGIIGGSSLGNFYSDSPWSCLRKLAYQFLGYKPSHERYYNDAMRKGHIYEPDLRDWFSEDKNVRCVEGDFVRHPEDPFLGGHPDGVFGEDGIIEIKTASPGSFANLRNKGMYESYKDQLTLYMAITERYSNAWFVVGNPEEIATKRFMVRFPWDQERYDNIIKKTLDFVMAIEYELPERCGKNKKGLIDACRNCEFRGLCSPQSLC